MKLLKQFHLTEFILKWTIFSALVGAVAGSASALFLVSLGWVSSYRESHQWIYYCLPLAGLFIGLLYYYLGAPVEKGNNLIIDEIIQPERTISWRMAPLVLLGTLVTHLAGGSAGREGTAVQMGGSLADQLNQFIPLKPSDRKILLLCGVSAGFASVFGTPLAGTVFALEVYIIGRMRYEALIPALFSAIIADYVCKLWGVGHTHYIVHSTVNISLLNLLLAIVAGLCFAFAGWIFNQSVPFLKRYFDRITYPPLRPFAGGLVLILLYLLINDYRFAGLGISTIVESFGQQEPVYFFALKILLTAITLASGFKGGEVTPLFFIGATLGSALAALLPLPTDLLAAMGFVAVFAAAANTPLACLLMGIELFGSSNAVFMALACFIAYLFSGHSGIYSSQLVGSPKHVMWGLHKGQKLNEIK